MLFQPPSIVLLQVVFNRPLFLSGAHLMAISAVLLDRTQQGTKIEDCQQAFFLMISIHFVHILQTSRGTQGKY